MDINDEKVPSIVELDTPIEFELLKKEVAVNGPLCISNRDSPYKVLLNPTPCRCSDQGCSAELIMVSRQHGLFEMQWVVSKEEFLEFDSIDAFFTHVISEGFQDSRGERMIIETHIDRIYREIHDATPELACSCPKCLAVHVGDDVSNMVLVSQLAGLLTERSEFLAEAREWDEENSTSNFENNDSAQDEEGSLEQWVESAFELGYSLGRNFSEYSGKAEIEPLALLGIEAKDTKRKRELAAGEKSRKSREARRATLFRKMEALAARNPDMVKLSENIIANLALKDCIEEDAAMWRQGPGQVNEYLGEIRRGEAGQDMQKRYQALFRDKPPKRLRGLR